MAMLRLLAVLCLVFGASGSAWAACTSPQEAGIASGGTATFTCSLFGFDNSPIVAPSHGSLSFGIPSNVSAVVYTNNGDGALFDTFTLRDFDTDTNVTFNITVGPASQLVVSPSSLPTPAVGVAYSQTLSTSGGNSPYTYSLGSGTLPPGLSLSSAGVISGTSTASGPHAFSVNVVDSTSPEALTASKSYSITIPAPTLDIAPDVPAHGAISTPYSLTFTGSGGTAPYTFSIEAGLGTLPPGLSMSSAGVVSGTPTATGSFTFSLKLDDSTTISTGGDHFIAQNVTITIDPPPTISVAPATVPNGTVGSAYSQTITASGGTSPYTFAVTAGALPAGLSLSSAGALSGTPTAGGSFNFTVTATDNNSFTGSRAYTLTIAAPTIAVAPTTLPNATVGSAYSQTITGSGGTSPYSFSITAGSLPAGLTLAPGGTLSGTPTAGGSFSFTVTATDSSTGTGPFVGSRAYSLTVNAATVAVAPATLPNGTLASAYSHTITASGGTATYSFATTAGALPPGLALSSGGVLSGTPTADGTFNFTVTATDSSTGTGPYIGSRAYALTIANIPPVANAVSATVAFESGANPITLNITGGVPTSVAVGTASSNGTALASGTSITYQPNAGYIGPDSFTYTATNSAGTSAPATVSITVSAPPLPVANNVSATVAHNSGANPITLNITGGTPTSVAVPSAPTHGTAIASGTGITYQPDAGYAGPDSFTYTASNAGGTSAPATVSITVSAPTITMSPASLTDGVAGTAYSQAFSGGGGTAPYSFSLVAGSLPVGMSLSSLGAFSGTPVVAGTFNFTVRATDSNGFTGDQAYSFVVVTPTITISPSTLSSGVAGTAYSQTFSAGGGAAPYSYSLVSGSLPVGMSFSSLGTFSGTPVVAGTFNFTLRATDSNGFTGDQAYSFVIASPTITISPSSLTDGVAGSAYSQTFSGGGGTAPYSFSLVSGSLPIGMSLSSLGAFSGTPVSTGTFTFTLRATDANGFTADQAYSFVVASPTITISPSSLPAGVAGTAYSQTFTAGGGAAPYTYSLVSGSIPIGVALSSAGVFSGTPTVDGTYTFTLRATDLNGFTADQVYTVVIAAPTISLTPASLPSGVAGTAYSQTITASGGIAPYSFSLAAGSLPAGMSLSGAGLLSGTPTAAGTYAFTLRATDNGGFTADQAYTLVIASPSITLTPTTLPGGLAGTAYSQTVSGSGGTAPYTLSLHAGALPTGLSLSSSGVLSGTPTAAGSFSFTLRAADAHAFIGDHAYTVVIAAPTIAVAPAALPNGLAGTTYSQTITASGGTAPYTYAVTTGTLPVGVALASGGGLSGTPTAAGSYTFQITATDALGFSGAHAYSLVIDAAAPVAVDDAATTDAGVAVTVPVTDNDSGTIDSVAVASVPAHGTATVSGLDIVYTPNASFFGSDSFTYVAEGPGGTSNVATVSITVNALPTPVGVPQTMTVLSGNSVAFDAATGASGSPFTGVTLVTTPSTGTVSVSGTVITYAAPLGASGTVSIGYTLNNAFGASAPITSTVVIDPMPIAAAHSVTTMTGVPVHVDLNPGASGGPFVAAAVVVVSPAAAGTTEISESGNPGDRQFRLKFTPAAGFIGTAQVSYTLRNAYATSAPAVVTIQVTERPDPARDAEVMGLLSAQASETRRFAQGQIGNFQSRMESLHDGAGSGFDNGITVAITRRCADGRAQRPGERCPGEAFAPATNAVDAMATGDSPAQNTSRMGIWTAGNVSFGDDDARGSRDGFEFETRGVSVGVDHRLNPAFAFGAGLGYGRDVTDVGDNGTESKARAHSLAVYVSYHPGRAFYLDGLLGYQWLSFDARRYVPATGGLVYGERDGTQWFGSLAASYEHRDEAMTVAPYLRVDLSRATLDSYTENGDPIFALHYAEQDVDSTTGNLGVRFEFRRKLARSVFSPLLRLEYQHEFDDIGTATLNYADMLTGPFYRAQIPGQDRNRFMLGVGAILQTERDWMLRAEYRGLFGEDDQSEHSIILNIEKQF